MNTGSWVDLALGGVWVRAQLTWASPHQTLFMFISGKGLAHSMSRRTLDRLRNDFSQYPGARISLITFENSPPINAPIAIRIPISRVRCETEYAITPYMPMAARTSPSTPT